MREGEWNLIGGPARFEGHNATEAQGSSMTQIVSRIWQSAKRGETVQHWQRFILWHLRQVRERTIDFIYNVDTFGPSPDDVRGGRWPYAYDTAPWSAPLKILKHLRLEFSESTFIDMGSGKGRVVLAASTLPFASVVGVEFSPPLCRIAEKNIVSCRVLRRQARETRIVESDATAFAGPDTPCVYYFYNPFSRDLMKTAIDNIISSYRQNPRKLYLICVGMSTIISDIIGISGLKLQHSFDLSMGLFNTRSVYIFLVADD
jgi:hypothetical protein